MNKTKIKKEVKKFLQQIDYPIFLTNLLKQTDYIIYFYTDENLNDDSILSSIDEAEYAKTVNSFSFERKEQQLIFIRENLDYEEKVFLALHEIGHLVLEHHKNQDTYFAITLEQEQEANFFASSIYKYDKNKLIKRNILLTSILAGFVLIGSTYFLINHISNLEATKIDNTECFITATGKCYHINCDYLKDNDGVTWITIKEAKNRNFIPCKKCFPEEYKNSDV